MELGPEADLIVYVDGVYNDKATSHDGWIAIHERIGVPLVFDYQHFWCNHWEGLELRPALERCLASWPAGARPKIHFSSPRTEMRTAKHSVTGTRRSEEVQLAPIWTGHAHYLNPFEFITFMRRATGLDFDVMLEAKVKDLALIRIRQDLQRYAQDVALRFRLEAPAGSE